MADIDPDKLRAERTVFCKGYHRHHGASDAGEQRARGARKSRCPGWASSDELRRRLIADALEDPDGVLDSWGHPKRVWNAVAGWIFVGVSTNSREATYNCYPEVPATALRSQLGQRADRTIEELLPEDQR